MTADMYGLFDLANPVFDAIDSVLLNFLPDTLRLVLWALVAASASMALYWLLSPQKKITDAAEHVRAQRVQLSQYDGDFDGLPPLAIGLLRASFWHFGLILGPALGASLPVLFLLSWASLTFGYIPPEQGGTMELVITPADAAPVQNWPGSPVPEKGRQIFTWPDASRPLVMIDNSGLEVARLPFAHPVAILHKRQWWNFLFENPNGYIDDNSSVEQIDFELTPRHFLELGPIWARGWEFIFFASLVIASLAIKFIFRIR
jgi:hypothetical protein